MNERRVVFCNHKDHEQKYPPRLFLLPGERIPNCPDHPGRKMLPQPNKPYRKQAR